jgi:hypothetical protein
MPILLQYEYSKNLGVDMFETMVDQLVKVTLTNEPVKTEFHNGTLFVRKIDENQARKVFHRLSKTLGLGSVYVTPIGNTGEYAFDFVAEKQQDEFSPFATVNS